MKFLDRYTSDEGEALLRELKRAGDGATYTKEGLRFLCFGAAQALGVAKAQHQAKEEVDHG